MSNFWIALHRPFSVLAPMEGATDFVFREIISKYAKPDVLFTEFTNSEGLTGKGYEFTIHRLKYSINQRPIIAQLWGTNPKTIYESAKIVREMGFDGVDLNMGCPDRAVMKKGSGASLINNPELAAELIHALKSGAQELSISVKTRLGVDEFVTENWVPFLLRQGLDALTIHGRIAKDQSNKPANWDLISQCVSFRNDISPKTVIIGNGDVTTKKQLKAYHKKYLVDGVMIGRGVFYNFFVFQDEIYNIDFHSRNIQLLEILLEHTKLYIDTWGDGKNFNEMKRFFKVYVKGFNGANKLKQDLMDAQNYEEVEKLIKPILVKSREEFK